MEPKHPSQNPVVMSLDGSGCSQGSIVDSHQFRLKWPLLAMIELSYSAGSPNLASCPVAAGTATGPECRRAGFEFLAMVELILPH